MASHGVTRTTRSRTEEQKQQELGKIVKYRDLEDQVRAHIAANKYRYTPDVFQLTTKLLRLNPEYYTIWNVRRRLLISGLLSKPSAGSSPSRASPSSSPTAITTTSSADSSSSSSTATHQNPACQKIGKSGTTADATDTADAKDASPTGSGAEDTRVKSQKNDLDVLTSELGFTVPLLMEFPKCYWIWKYRSWLLQEAIERLDSPVARRIWEEELGLDTKMLTRDRRNFHAWGYRRNVVKHLESATLKGKSMVESEYNFTDKMIRADLSNFSAWHSRSKLLPRLLDERGVNEESRREFFDEELQLINEALNVGPDDQSLWYYHQFLMLDIIEHVGRPTITACFTNEERVSYVDREVENIRDLLDDYDDCKLIYERLIEYTLALAALAARQLTSDEESDLKIWLSKLQELDPMRSGRWVDMEKEMSLGR